MTIDVEQVRAAVEGMRSLVNADGADLELESVDGATVVVRLKLEQVGCIDCVLPHAMLASMLEEQMIAAVPDLEKVSLRDPRTEPGFAASHHGERA